MCPKHCLKIKWDKPIEFVAGRTSSSGTGPGIADGLRNTNIIWAEHIRMQFEVINGKQIP